MFTNLQPRYEILSAEALETLDFGWRRIVSEIGVEFLLDEAVDVLRQHGQRVDGSRVLFDPDWVTEQVRKAPAEFAVQARNAAHDVRIGGGQMVFGPVYGPPFVREGEVRRDACMRDFTRLVQLSQSFPEIDLAGGTVCEPSDRPLDSRHLDMLQTLLSQSDKPFMGSVISATNAEDTLEMASIVLGSREAVEAVPTCMNIINVNSPLRYDDRMLSALLVYVRARQPVIITPFLLMGAMSPVSIPASLAQQLAEGLAGIALVQAIEPGCPVILGSFLSNTDMQSGSPSFGTPESAIGLFCTGQIARHLGLPWRSGGGGLTASQSVDAQAAYESLMTMMPAFLAGANLVMHAAGWLESGLVSSFEKFIVDIELVRMLQETFSPLEIDEASLAFGAHQEVGPGGHFLGAAHTLERFRECFYRPLLSSTENFERWKRNGGRDATQRASEIWQRTIAEFEPPALDPAVAEELDAYVRRRRAELGDPDPDDTPAPRA